MSNALADRLVATRKRLQLSQAQVAKMAGLSQGTIGNIESGLRGYGRSVTAIARALGVSPEYLLRETESDLQPPGASTTLPAGSALSNTAWEIGALFDDLFKADDRIGRAIAFNAATEALLQAYRQRNVQPTPKQEQVPSPRKQRA